MSPPQSSGDNPANDSRMPPRFVIEAAEDVFQASYGDSGYGNDPNSLRPSTSDGYLEGETEEERIQREIEERNERSLIRRFNVHKQNIEVCNNMNIHRSTSLDDLEDYAVIV